MSITDNARPCDQCGKQEGPLGCPVCDAIDRAEVVRIGQTFRVKLYRKDDAYCAVVETVCDTAGDLFMFLEHHDVPVIVMRGWEA